MGDLQTKDLDAIAFDLLKSSKSIGLFPTPVEKIVEYAELRINAGGFHDVPKNFIARNADAFQRMMNKVLGAFDRQKKEIYINPSMLEVKKNFVKLHEVGHGVIPWQKALNYQDDDVTLNPDVEEKFEREANYFASATLFQLNRFEDDAAKLPLEIGSVIALAKTYGGSNHACARRYVETSKKRCALLVLKKDEASTGRKSLAFRNFFTSKSFQKNFGSVCWPEIFSIEFPFVADYSRSRRFHKDGTIQLFLNGSLIDFEYHYFDNKFNVFVLILPVGEKIKSNTTILLSK